MKIILIALFACLSLGCATSSGKNFSKKEVLNDFDRAWDSYWSNNRERSWSKSSLKRDIKRVKLKSPLEK
jgi:hypothetical protein